MTSIDPICRSWTVLLLLAGGLPVTAQAIHWPQEITADEGVIVVYQPQPERLRGNVLRGRAAMSLELTDHDEPVFGAFWFDARIDTDAAAGTAVIRDLTVTNVRWPDSKDASEQRFSHVVEDALPASGFEISRERLSASLEDAEVERESLAELKSEPPRIVFRERLAVLLLYDGEPRFSAVNDSRYERALNTPFVVVRNRDTAELYLGSGALWYRADEPLGPWTPVAAPPADLLAVLPQSAANPAAPAVAPEVVVATEPTELIATDGAPDWQSLPGGELLYVGNTETAWLRDLASGNMYVLLSGRWFRARAREGPWTFVPADELPDGFRDIPPDSDIGGLRVSVAGTREAQDAVLDAQIPQTAAIKRSEATLTVEYDGAPKFENVPGTRVSYAVNTPSQVLHIDNRYYAVDDGVWFTAPEATGTWVVADHIPEDEIQQIPPSSPVYNTTYVEIYDATPEVVYVGYRPGYLWSFPYYGVPVYGTGWYYPPYWGTWYYPRPPTWGLNVGYNPWTGWNFGVSWSNGFLSFGASWGGAYHPGGCCGGWYGGGYRGPVVINTGDINIGNSINIGNRTTVANRLSRNDVDLSRARTNVYNLPDNRARNASPALARLDLQKARPVSARTNDVFVDRNGNVARRVDDSWETRQPNGGWSRDDLQQRIDGVSPATRDRAHTTFQSLDRSSLDRAAQMRQHGMSRERFSGRVQGMGMGRRR